MARYFFHIRDGWGVIPDDEGMELPSWSAAEAEAFASTSDLARKGCGQVRTVEVTDQAGKMLESFRVPLRA